MGIQFKSCCPSWDSIQILLSQLGSQPWQRPGKPGAGSFGGSWAERGSAGSSRGSGLASSCLPATVLGRGGRQGPLSGLGHSQAVLGERLRALLPLMWGWDAPAGAEGGAGAGESGSQKMDISAERAPRAAPAAGNGPAPWDRGVGGGRALLSQSRGTQGWIWGCGWYLCLLQSPSQVAQELCDHGQSPQPAPGQRFWDFHSSQTGRERDRGWCKLWELGESHPCTDTPWQRHVRATPGPSCSGNSGIPTIELSQPEQERFPGAALVVVAPCLRVPAHV